MIDEDDVELGAPQIGQARGRGERQVAEFGMRIVDDVDSDFNRRLGRLPGGGRIAGQRHENADLHGVGRARRCGGQHGRHAAQRYNEQR